MISCRKQFRRILSEKIFKRKRFFIGRGNGKTFNHLLEVLSIECEKVKDLLDGDTIDLNKLRKQLQKVDAVQYSLMSIGVNVSFLNIEPIDRILTRKNGRTRNLHGI